MRKLDFEDIWKDIDLTADTIIEHQVPKIVIINNYPQPRSYPYPWHGITPPPVWGPNWYYEPKNWTWTRSDTRYDSI